MPDPAVASARFPHRCGFARVTDLDEPALQALLHRCRSEQQRFFGGDRLGWSRQWEYPYVLANLPPPEAGTSVLDAGCGATFFTLLLARAGYRVRACDADRSAGRRLAETARRHRLSVETRTEDLTATGYLGGSLDVVTCISVLEHTRDPETVLVELHRILRPGGRLLLTFDVSVDGRRRIPVAGARRLVERARELFDPVDPFTDGRLLDEEALAASHDVLRTGWFRRHRPDLLPWRWISRAALGNLLRGRFHRPFFDLAVVGLNLRKVGGPPRSRGAEARGGGR